MGVDALRNWGGCSRIFRREKDLDVKNISNDG